VAAVDYFTFAKEAINQNKTNPALGFSDARLAPNFVILKLMIETLTINPELTSRLRVAPIISPVAV